MHNTFKVMENKLSNDLLNARWLLLCAALVFMMAVIGAVTRLTESGLSIAEWKPVTGALPPLTAAQWDAEFNTYRETPQYQKINKGMTLPEFKQIYFWEWLHRLWGRMIGLAFALPLAFFWLTGRLAQGYKVKYLGLLALGGLQGFVGWWMVKSGLIDNPAVSHYRLATHLSLALTLGAILFWMALTLARRDGAIIMRPIHSTPCLRRHGRLALAFISVTILWGAFVAGLDAGLIYNTWPMMGGAFMPGEMWDMQPLLKNLMETHASVQFIHRWIAFAAFALTLSFAWRTRSPILGTAVFVQFCLGILTLLSHVALPLATLHQAGAMVTLAALLYELHRTLLGAGATAR